MMTMQVQSDCFLKDFSKCHLNRQVDVLPSKNQALCRITAVN